MNLDQIAYEYANKLFENIGEDKKYKEYENFITDLLHIVIDNSLYAGYLFIKKKSKNNKEFETVLYKYTVNIIEDTVVKDEDKKDLLSIITVVNQDLYQIFFVKDLWERMLTYARFIAKARGN